MNEEILKTVRERGLLLEREVFDLLRDFGNEKIASQFLENLERLSGQKAITKSLLVKNYEFVRKAVNDLVGENKSIVENTFVKLGITLEIRKETQIEEKKTTQVVDDYQIFYANTKTEKKRDISDFVSHFRARYQQLQRILMARQDLQNLVAIGKVSSERKNHTIIGIVVEKRMTKNKNLIVKFEDLTGEINVLFKPDRGEAFSKAEDLLLDDVVAVRASGSREIMFGSDIFYPDAFVPEKMKFDKDTSIAFISDIHCGGSGHLSKSFENFLLWINSDDEDAKKIKYLFIVGDNIDGVGVYPSQEFSLKLKSVKLQYALLASYLKRVPKRITMFMCAGQHDAVRLAEPQPIIGKAYAPDLYDIENLVLVTNPSTVKLIEGKKEFKVLMYHGDSIHSIINGVKELREKKAGKTPAKAVREMLRRRHLFPMHSEAVYLPNADKDPLVIEEVPDLVCTGEVHRLDIENYNGIIIITGSCWQAMTAFEEKVGNFPDPAKVPVLNLKTRELKIFDFLDEEETKK